MRFYIKKNWFNLPNRILHNFDNVSSLVRNDLKQDMKEWFNEHKIDVIVTRDIIPLTSIVERQYQGALFPQVRIEELRVENDVIVIDVFYIEIEDKSLAILFKLTYE